MLLDSSAQVTRVGKAWMERELPTVKIQPLESFFTSQSLEITAINGAELPYEGWAEVNLQICSQNHRHIDTCPSVSLLTGWIYSCPVLGSNIIAEVIEENASHNEKVDVSTILVEASGFSTSRSISVGPPAGNSGWDITPQCPHWEERCNNTRWTDLGNKVSDLGMVRWRDNAVSAYFGELLH